MRLRTFTTSAFLVFFMIPVISLIQSCGGSDPGIDCASVKIELTAETQISECPKNNGSVSISASGGSGSFEYSINGADFLESNVFEGLGGGEYEVTVKDSNGCTSKIDVVVETSSDISFNYNSSEAGCGTSNGGLTIIPSGGSGSYQFSIDDGGFQSENEFDGIGYGIHLVTVKDGNECEQTAEVYVLSGISYENSVATIIDTYCAVSGCHVTGEPRPDFTIFTNVQNHAADIKSRTQSGNMPRGTTLSAEQIQAIACWVDDGAKDN